MPYKTRYHDVDSQQTYDYYLGNLPEFPQLTKTEIAKYKAQGLSRYLTSEYKYTACAEQLLLMAIKLQKNVDLNTVVKIAKMKRTFPKLELSPLGDTKDEIIVSTYNDQLKKSINRTASLRQYVDDDEFLFDSVIYDMIEPKLPKWLKTIMLFLMKIQIQTRPLSVAIALGHLKCSEKYIRAVIIATIDRLDYLCTYGYNVATKVIDEYVLAAEADKALANLEAVAKYIVNGWDSEENVEFQGNPENLFVDIDYGKRYQCAYEGRFLYGGKRLKRY